MWKTILNIIYWIVIAILVIVILMQLFFHLGICNIKGDSMEPTLHDGQKVIQFETNDYKAGDIIVINVVSEQSDETIRRDFYVKRIVAVPGDTVVVDETGTYVNGEFVAAGTTWDASQNWGGEETITYTLQANEYWVQGDNYENSKDSRVFGPVNLDEIYSEIIKY